MDTMKQSDQTIQLKDKTIQLKGLLCVHSAPRLGLSNDLGDDPNCLLFELHNPDRVEHFGRQVTYTLRVKPAAEERAESSNSKDSMLSDSLTPKEAMLFDSSSWAQAVLYNATTETTDLRLEDNDLYEIAELPTRHIVLGKGEMDKALVRRAVKRHAVTLGLPDAAALRRLPAFLADLGTSAPLRHIAMDMSRGNPLNISLDDLVEKIRRSGVQGVSFSFNWEKGLGRLDFPWETFLKRISMSMPYVGLRLQSWPNGVPENWMDRLPWWREPYQVKNLYVQGCCDLLVPAVCEVNLCCMTRLDLGDEYRQEVISLLIHVLPLVNESVVDLGLPIWETGDLERLFSSNVHSKIRVLRLHFQTDDPRQLKRAWQLLILDEFSTVQFLDCTFDRFAPSILLQGFAGTKPPAALTALRFRSIRFQRGPEFFSSVADFLSSPAACNLVYLHFTTKYFDSSVTAAANWQVANSIINNFALCAFHFPFTETAAESYAVTLVRRNRLYRDSNLLNEPQVKPNVAKVFLCGHGRVGKTTLRRALQSMQRPRPMSKLTMRLPNLRPGPTRGMETSYLSLQHPCKKLLICDLAGQEEYHVFHHYFMNASINDIFIVVCKYDNTGLPLEHFRLQLQYWLRFIVSHRSIRDKSFDDSGTNHTEMKPKVLVVVNFFQKEKHADNITRAWTSPLMQKFSEVLDFAVAGETQQHKSYKNLFWLNARKRFRVQELTERLEALLRDFDDAALPIPKLCYDISAHLTHGHRKNRLGANILATKKGKIRFLTSYMEVLNMISQSKAAAVDQSSKVQAALKELHSQGRIIFFPTGAADGRSNSMKGGLVAENSTNDTLVITDTNWFSNKVVGSLLGTRLPGAMNRSCPWLWNVEEIKNMLREHGCGEHEHEEILRYLVHLELCVSLDSVSGAEKGYLLFPALVEKKEIEFPEGSTESSTTFFGRRLKCNDPSIHLIPSAIFTRLQVKLHGAYAAENNSFKLGDGWISFTKGRVGPVVRYGGDMINDAWENKQQIDILIFCPEIHRRTLRPSTSSNMKSYQHEHIMNDPKLKAAEAVLDDIRSHLFATCKEGGLGGIPTVDIEEMVLQSKTEGSDYCGLSHILNKVRKTQELLECYQEWRTAVSTPVLELLLPKEIEAVMRDRFNALASIQEEFSQGTEDDGSEDVHCVDEHQSRDAICDSQPSSDLDMKLFIESQITHLKKYLDTNFQTVRADIRNLENVQREVMQTIIANCSTRLLRHELRKDRAYGLYPYLVDVEGKLAPLWEALFGKRVVRVQFLCESPTDGGPHPVKDQKGKEVSIDWKPWVKKAARVMVPAVKVICLLARVAASVYLPSAQVFIPSPEALVSGLGIEAEALQHVILPRALEAFLKNVPDVDWREQMKRGTPAEQEVQEMVAAILQNKNVDMWADFSLKRVIFDDDEQSIHHRPLWVCDRHARQKAELRPIKNPYGTSEFLPL